jgi:hypothetical protein
VPRLKGLGYDVTYREYDGGHGVPAPIVTKASSGWSGSGVESVEEGTAMIMRLKDTPLAIALVVLVASVAYPQPPQTNRGRDVPDFSVQVWSDIVTDFTTRVLSYVALRTELERGLPALTVTGDPAEIRRTKQALAKRIREARAKARQGDIFTATISVEFRKALVPRSTPRPGRPSWTITPGNSRLRSTASTRKENPSPPCRRVFCGVTKSS